MNKDILLDSLLIEGEDREELKTSLEKMNDQTSFNVVYPSDLKILSFKNKLEEQTNDESKIKLTYTFYILDRNSLRLQAATNSGFKEIHFVTETYKNKYNFKAEFFESIISSTGMLLDYVDKKKERHLDAVSQFGITNLCNKAGLRGERIRENSLFRDAYVAHGLLSNGDYDNISEEEEKRIDNLMANGFSFIRRYNGKERQKEDRHLPDLGLVVGAFSGGFKGMKQSSLFDILESIEKDRISLKTELVNWRITQECTSIYVEFNQYSQNLMNKYNINDEFVSGLEIRTSDCGTESLTANLTIRHNDNIFYIGDVKKRHRGVISINQFVRDIKKRLIVNIESFYEKLSKLQNKTLDINNSYEFEIYQGVISGIFKNSPSIVKALGSKRIAPLSEDILDIFLKSTPKTNYEVFITFLNIFEFINSSDSIKDLRPFAKDLIKKDLLLIKDIDYQKIISNIKLEDVQTA